MEGIVFGTVGFLQWIFGAVICVFAWFMWRESVTVMHQIVATTFGLSGVVTFGLGSVCMAIAAHSGLADKRLKAIHRELKTRSSIAKPEKTEAHR